MFRREAIIYNQGAHLYPTPQAGDQVTVGIVIRQVVCASMKIEQYLILIEI
jgi:hypothetical protein